MEQKLTFFILFLFTCVLVGLSLLFEKEVSGSLVLSLMARGMAVGITLTLAIKTWRQPAKL